jgi:hypothetical protein
VLDAMNRDRPRDGDLAFGDKTSSRLVAGRLPARIR